jgi:hypothetical protein
MDPQTALQFIEDLRLRAQLNITGREADLFREAVRVLAQAVNPPPQK